MDASTCPTADAIRAFLEYLVDPLLQEDHSTNDDLPLSQHEKVANQVHAVVLLNNYYHIKLNQELAFLPYREFCKIIVDLRPPLSAYMKFMLQPDYAELVDVEQKLSLTEKAIMSSHDICLSLDASKHVPNIEGWPISKVAVLLVDSKKENCFLRFNSFTDGVWSLIEKDVDTSYQIAEVTSEIKSPYKRRGVIMKRSKVILNEDQLLQVGYSAVKEAASVNSIDMMLLGSYNVYSQSKERTASRFYIMKCSQSIVEGFTKVPIKDLIESFRGPLVKRSSSSWKTTPVVKYFHMLPYSEIISEWISREAFSNSLQDLNVAEKQFSKVKVRESHVEKVCSTRMHISKDGIKDQPASDTISKNEFEGCASNVTRKNKKDRKQIGSHDTNQEGPNTRDKNGPIKVGTNSSDTPNQRPKRLIKRPSRFNT
ncbi:uncharacterized protein [Medicago truncatula]|uniref:Uncharacterized protein n=1 Tax=Medicago truncatula TaxID=3880 RepID=G7IHT1_MEDTR|nr:uncharacterized protein LOC11423265 [Medicago truncatula]AES67753.1 hypothetical protein MTR_2g098710 [Medicago truncatula]